MALLPYNDCITKSTVIHHRDSHRVVWLGRQDPHRTGLSLGGEHGVQEV